MVIAGKVNSYHTISLDLALGNVSRKLLEGAAEGLWYENTFPGTICDAPLGRPTARSAAILRHN